MSLDYSQNEDYVSVNQEKKHNETHPVAPPNFLISRDESLHSEFAIRIMRKASHPVSPPSHAPNTIDDIIPKGKTKSERKKELDKQRYGKRR